MTTVYNGKIARKAWMAAPETEQLMNALMATGVEARFVGGCVRNALVNRAVIDIDIATPLTPDKVIEHLSAAKIRYIPTGLAHGTVTALVDDQPFEITTLRIDVSGDGRHAEVAFTDNWEQDAARRDFTINAMSANLAGDVYDPYSGIEDLRNGRVVFVGEPARRIEEDVLRILRFFRFFAHFGQGDAPDAAGLAACRAAAPLIPNLSVERVRDEIFKLLEAERCALTWRVMIDAGIVAQCLPQAVNVPVLEKLLVLEHDHHSHPFVLRRLAALLAGQNVDVDALAKKLRLSNDQASQLSLLLDPDQGVTTDMSPEAIRAFVYRHGNDAARSMLLLAAAKGDNGKLDDLYVVATAFRPPRLPVNGDDVMKLGWPAGPDVGRILRGVEDWWISQDFKPGRTETIAHMRDVYTPPAAAEIAG